MPLNHNTCCATVYWFYGPRTFSVNMNLFYYAPCTCISLVNYYFIFVLIVSFSMYSVSFAYTGRILNIL